jgi:hypothetical protein
MHVTTFADNPKADIPMVSDRTDPTSVTGFTRFRSIAPPRGNSAIGFTSDVYGIREAWFHHAAMPAVFRGQAHPATRPAPFNDSNASAWTVSVQDATGRFSAATTSGTANSRLQEVDSPEVGGLTVPQFMPVGVLNPQMYACTISRSDDGAVRTTRLVEMFPPPASPMASGVQDLLSGDDRFVPNAPGPLVGPSSPPTPTLHNLPGFPVRDGTVACAMTQLDDDLATRELHMLAISGGRLYHAMANNWSEATRSPGSTFFRFNTVSQWGDVVQALGANLTDVESAAIVARPRSVSVFFFAKSNGVNKLWHTVRFSSSNTWRPADDVLSLSGVATGFSTGWRIAAGECPLFGPEASGTPQNDTELVYVMYKPDGSMLLGRIVSSAVAWSPGMTGSYSPLGDIASFITWSSDSTRNQRIDSMAITTRPWADNATPPP